MAFTGGLKNRGAVFPGMLENGRAKTIPEEILERLRSGKGYELDVPFPVSCNKLHIPNGNHGIALSGEARGYYQHVAMWLLTHWPYPPIEGRLRVDIKIHEPNRIRRDVNNYTKTLFDALERGGLFVNDSQIDETHIYRGELKEHAQCLVTVHELGPDVYRKSIRELNEEKESLEIERASDKMVRRKARSATGDLIESPRLKRFTLEPKGKKGK